MASDHDHEPTPRRGTILDGHALCKRCQELLARVNGHWSHVEDFTADGRDDPWEAIEASP